MKRFQIYIYKMSTIKLAHIVTQLADIEVSFAGLTGFPANTKQTQYMNFKIITKHQIENDVVFFTR